MPTLQIWVVCEYTFETVEKFKEDSSGAELEAIEKAYGDFPTPKDAEDDPHEFAENFVDHMYPGLDCFVNYDESDGQYHLQVYDIHRDFIKKVIHILDHPEEAPLHLGSASELIEAIAQWRLKH